MNPFGLTFHHFGLSVRVFEQARRFLEGSGYTVTTAVFDPQQGVNLAMAENPVMPKVEIIWPAAETSSSLEKMVRKHPGGVIYHACYVAESLERSLAAMAAADLNPVCMSAAKPAVLFGLTPVAFYTIPGMGLVELIDGEPGPPVASALIPFEVSADGAHRDARILDKAPAKGTGQSGARVLDRAAMARILITSALPYINGVKHLGNLAGSQLPADVYARFQRARGREVLLVCATDEHGTPAELAAAAAGREVRAYCDEQHALQRDVGAAFGLSWDWFGRSSSPENQALTQAFADALEDHGLIEERTDQMIYSLTDRRFLPDRYVEGTCPVCAHRPARGDQCDNCGSLLDPLDLKEPYSAISGSTDLEVRQTRHLYLRQTRLQDQIRAWVDSRTDFPALTRAIALKHLDEGLIDRGITRDLSWGVPVTRRGAPRPGFETKVFYVWFDAPIEYIAATQEWARRTGGEWERWWRGQAAADVTYVQFMGKDNVAFHTVSFPATVMGVNGGFGEDGVYRVLSQSPFKLVDQLKTLNWLNWYGGKFSTSQKRGVFMDAALEILPADVWRWYLTANAPENADSAFTWEQFQLVVNKDLADVLGNFVNRILRFAESRFEGQIPAGGALGPLEERLGQDLGDKLAELTSLLEAIEIRKSAQALRAIWVLGNEYLTEAAPWTALKTDPERAAVIVRTGLNLVGLFARLCHPFMPFTADTIAASVQEPALTRWPTADGLEELQRLAPGAPVAAPPVLFRKIEAEDLDAWRLRFGGGDDA